MKNIIYILSCCIALISCHSYKTDTYTPNNGQTTEQDTVKIANDELEYEIIIIDPGFSSWLATMARPRGFHSQKFMENRNLQWVIAWNQRALQSFSYNPNLYQMQIDYQAGIDYGYEVNYMLYNYFLYFQLKHNQQLSHFIPRI